MKNIAFSSADQYEIIYESMCSCLEGFKGAQTRIVAKIFDKLETIGKPKTEESHLYTLITTDNTGICDDGFYPNLDFEDAEFSIIKNAFESVPWSGMGARKAAIVYDLLESIK